MIYYLLISFRLRIDVALSTEDRSCNCVHLQSSVSCTYYPFSFKAVGFRFRRPGQMAFAFDVRRACLQRINAGVTTAVGRSYQYALAKSNVVRRTTVRRESSVAAFRAGRLGKGLGAHRKEFATRMHAEGDLKYPYQPEDDDPAVELGRAVLLFNSGVHVNRTGICSAAQMVRNFVGRK
eukprot:786904-Prorocentrum_minimum.AAC.2